MVWKNLGVAFHCVIDHQGESNPSGKNCCYSIEWCLTFLDWGDLVDDFGWGYQNIGQHYNCTHNNPFSITLDHWIQFLQLTISFKFICLFYIT